jgi:prepilin-type N-terminal cleavage/methylation domain-containing protein
MFMTGKKRINQKGFTLIEILIVIIILGVIAGLAVPLYRAQVEKSRQVEALQVLSSVRDAEVRFFSSDGVFTDDFAQLDYTPPSTDPGDTTDDAGQTLHFSYSVVLTGGGTGFEATATRNAVKGGDGTSTVKIDQAGNVTKTGVFA